MAKKRIFIGSAWETKEVAYFRAAAGTPLQTSHPEKNSHTSPNDLIGHIAG
jgi:hypothetical protein